MNNILSKWRRRIVRQSIIAETGLTPFGSFQPEDFFIAGHPKSGNTWLHMMLAGLIYGVDLDVAPPLLLARLIPGNQFAYYLRLGTPSYFRIHALPKPVFARVIYVVRDGRDVVVSYYHHQQALSSKPISLLDVAEGRQVIHPHHYTWAEHVEAWQRNPFNAAMLTVRYEDLLGDAVRELKRILAFMGLERPDARLAGVVEQARFQRMQAREQAQGLGKSNWPADKPFMRRGIAGSYRDEMPPDVLDAFMKRSKKTLRALGYLDGENPGSAHPAGDG